MSSSAPEFAEEQNGISLRHLISSTSESSIVSQLPEDEGCNMGESFSPGEISGRPVALKHLRDEDCVMMEPKSQFNPITEAVSTKDAVNLPPKPALPFGVEVEGVEKDERLEKNNDRESISSSKTLIEPVEPPTLSPTDASASLAPNPVDQDVSMSFVESVHETVIDSDATMSTEILGQAPLSSCPVSHPADTSLTTNVILPNNYPPVIYPAISSPVEITSQETADETVFTREPNAENNSIVDDEKAGTAANAKDVDDDMSSDISEGTDLQDRLLEALHDDNFSFNGTFYHAGLLPSAPNPCLSISGLGVIGLPLSERDAKAIVSVANLAPFGHGERTVVDKVVRDTWEVEPASISFSNALWEKYINQTVCSEVCKSLGVTISAKSAPKMELYKLLLYETGSHFLPHQDTQKANGMFATVIILLPSAYTGGQLIISHASTTKTVDFSQESLLSAAVLAWYTDVKHEVKPVTSGHRLALSYNLVHVASSVVPCPSLPDMTGSVYLLRRVLRKWKANKFKGESEQNIIAYLLDHQYSTMNLKEGLAILKGADAHRVKFLQPVAEEMGFMVGLASLEHNISGSGEDDGGHYHNRGRYGYSSDEDDDPYGGDTPGMLEVTETTTSITGLVDLNGTALVSTGKIYLADDCLIPKDPFEDQDPDSTEYEGYMGNGAGQLDYWYRRTVLVLMHADNRDDICYEAEGLPFAVRMLQKSSAIPPTPDDRKWAERLLQKSNSWTKDNLTTMMDYSLKWKDIEMWKEIMKCPSCSLKVIDNDLLLKAWRVFSFEGVRVSFEEILARSKELPEQMSFIYNLQPEASTHEREIVRAWCKKESDKILSSYSTASVKDIPTILTIIRVAGLRSFIEVMMPKLSTKGGTFAFWLALRKSLKDSRQAILDRQAKSHSGTFAPSPVASSDGSTTEEPTQTEPNLTENVLDELIKTCLRLATSQWADEPPALALNRTFSWGSRLPTLRQPVAPARTTKIDHILEIVEQCVLSEEMDVCKDLFVRILTMPGPAATRFSQLYIPLIPRLCALLAKLKRDICSPPFLDLMQVLIGTYLHEVLGKKGQVFNSNLRKLGCGCGDCGPLDNFILDIKSTEITFRLGQSRRNHLEHRLNSATDLCTYETISTGNPHGLKIKKRAAIIQASQWEYRQRIAKGLLAAIGPNDVIAKIMGPRYDDVKSAIKGSQLFGGVQTVQAEAPVANIPLIPSMNKVAAISVNAPGPAQGSTSAPTHPPLASANAAQPSQPVAGKKRKSAPVILGPVIDLTGEDSS